MGRVALALGLFLPSAVEGSQGAQASIDRIWLTHRSGTPDRIVINWQTERPGESVVRYRPHKGAEQTVRINEAVTIHHVELPGAGPYRYRVQSGDTVSEERTWKGYPQDVLRVAVVADWQRRPSLTAIEKDDVHLLLTAGDNVANLHEACGAGIPDCTKPYESLIDAYPRLFGSVPFMPALGNHDRQIRDRGKSPPAEPVYDVEATAFRRFFELPGDEWKWAFDLPAFGVRFIALDLNHLSDQGTTWQTCHDDSVTSEQFAWYRKVMNEATAPFVVTIYNERHGRVRQQDDQAWKRVIDRGTIAVTGFGYFGERAEVDGTTYFNTSLSGTGAKIPDPASKAFFEVDNYLLMTFRKRDSKMTVEIKGLDGRVLERTQHAVRKRVLP